MTSRLSRANVVIIERRHSACHTFRGPNSLHSCNNLTQVAFFK
jgi:hypothetical protein